MGSYLSTPVAKVAPRTTFTLTLNEPSSVSYTFDAANLDFVTKTTGSLTFKVDLKTGAMLLVTPTKEEPAGTDGDFAKMRGAFVVMLRNIEGQLAIPDRIFTPQTNFNYTLSLMVSGSETDAMTYTFLSSDSNVVKKVSEAVIFKVDPTTQSMTLVAETESTDVQTDGDFETMKSAATTLLATLNEFVSSRPQ